MPRRFALLLVACLAGALTMPLATSSAAQAQLGGLDRGFGTGGNRTTGLGRYRPDPGLGARTGGGTVPSDGLGFTASGVASASGSPPVFQVAPCPPDIFPPSVRVDCGFVTVPENRARPTGRRITVAAAVMHAPAPHPKDDPIVFLDGGPSFGAISSFAVDDYFGGAAYTSDRDVILVDTRGTGFSEPRLGCPEFDRANVSASYSRPFVGSSNVADYTRAIRACRDRLTAAGIDLAAYNSAESAADLEALRRALGYRQWNLFALSADGVLGLTYMRLFPDRIRSAVVDSGQSPQHLWGLDYYRGLNELLERIFAGCAANAACNAAYPNIRGVFFDLVRRLQAHPVAVPIPDFQPRPVTVRVDGLDFYLSALFGIFPGNEFAPDTIRPLLSEIWRSAHGELTQVYQERLGTGPGDQRRRQLRGRGQDHVLCLPRPGRVHHPGRPATGRPRPAWARPPVPGSRLRAAQRGSRLAGGLPALEGGCRRPGAAPAGAQLDPDPGARRRIRRRRAAPDRAADPADTAPVVLSTSSRPRPTSSWPTATRSAPAPARSPASSSTRRQCGPTRAASGRSHRSTSRPEAVGCMEVGA